MTDALDAAPDGAMSDTLQEHVDDPRAPEVKTEPRPSLDDTLKAEVEKAVKGDDKPKDEPKAEKEPEPKAKAEKPEPKEKEPAEVKADADKAEAKPDDEAEAETDPKPEPKASAYRDPPNGFDDAAKKDWETTPESVRGAMNRRFQEMERGIHTHQQTAKEYEPIRKYAEMAKQHGTDLPTALQRYTSMEQALRTNPIQGLQAVVANLNLTKSDGSPVTLRDVAANIMGQTPDQAASRQEATISQLTNQVNELKQQLGGLSQHHEQQQEQQKVTTAQTEWDTFQADHPRAKELEGAIAEALQMQNAEAYPSLTQRLRHAYAVAEAQNPSVAHTDPKPLAQTQTPTRQPNPAGQKSVSGAGGESRTVRKTSSDEAIKKAIAKLNG
tara:strand:+ start:4673 stop:5824 length:1152 start_codon:yes stop_codon:yes gene_type:complete